MEVVAFSEAVRPKKQLTYCDLSQIEFLLLDNWLSDMWLRVKNENHVI